MLQILVTKGEAMVGGKLNLCLRGKRGLDGYILFGQFTSGSIFPTIPFPVKNSLMSLKRISFLVILRSLLYCIFLTK